MAAASALKLFSSTPLTKKMYRALGNSAGSKWREKVGLPPEYIERADRILRLFSQHNLPGKNARFLELGTGWVHWESTILSLFYDAEFTLFDIWDNRQLAAYKSYLSTLYEDFHLGATLPIEKQERAKSLLKSVLSASSFNEIYDLLGFQYVVETTGKLSDLQYGTYDACFSYNVFEHINKEITPEYIQDLYRLLKPGGYSIQKIEISDHLANYDPGVCSKYYLKYSDAAWKRFFENEVQYFNRIQRSEWLHLYEQAGFEILHEDSVSQSVWIKPNRQYNNLDTTDIECTTLEIIHRKPL